VAAAKAALDAGRTRYAPAAGLPELRAAVAEAYARDFGVRFGADEVAVATGGKHALYMVAQALLDRGDELIVPAPYWPTFPEAARLAGARAVTVELREEQGFRLTPERVRSALSPRTRAVVVNSPSNPTGAVVAPEDLLGIGRLARRHKLTLLYDDTYARLSFDAPAAPLQELRALLGERFVILGTASKSYCMTGWRIGWVLAGRGLAGACATLASHSTQGPATFAQVAAAQALGGSQQRVDELAREYRRRRDLIHAAVVAVPGVTCLLPAGAFYLFPNVSRYLSQRCPTTLALGERLLEEEGLATVPGEGFGRAGYLRLSFARPQDELREGARRLAAFLARSAAR
jgi:aspartate aminotransferase